MNDFNVEPNSPIEGETPKMAAPRPAVAVCADGTLIQLTREQELGNWHERGVPLSQQLGRDDIVFVCSAKIADEWKTREEVLAYLAEKKTPIASAPNFAPADLEHFPKRQLLGPDTAFRYIAGALINFAKEPGEYGFKDGTESRFECSFDADTVTENRALLRMLRASLDCLEADFLAGEAANIAEMREALAGLEAVQKQPLRAALPVPDGANVPPIEPPADATEASAEDEPVFWPDVAHALHTLATFAEDIHKGTEGDWTSDISETRELCAALELGRVGVGHLREEFKEELARATEWRRKDIEAFAALEIEGPEAA